MSVDSFFSRLNPLVVLWLRLPLLHHALSRGLMLLTWTGRRSGRSYTIPVGYQHVDGGLTVMVSEARRKQWWRNFREAGPVILRLRGETRRGQARLVAADTEEFRTGAERTFRRVPSMVRVFRVEGYDRDAGLSESQLAELGREIAMVRIRLDPTGS